MACKAIAKSVAYGELAGMLGKHDEQGNSVNVRGTKATGEPTIIR